MFVHSQPNTRWPTRRKEQPNKKGEPNVMQETWLGEVKHGIARRGIARRGVAWRVAELRGAEPRGATQRGATQRGEAQRVVARQKDVEHCNGRRSDVQGRSSNSSPKNS